MEDGQGVHSFLLFGLTPHVLGAYQKSVRRARRRLYRCYRQLARLEPDDVVVELNASGREDAEHAQVGLAAHEQPGGHQLVDAERHVEFFSLAGTTNPGW